MFDNLKELFQIDWNIFMAGAETWLHGGNPYGPVGGHAAGAFAYPPTSLTWMALFLPFGALSFYLWTALELAGWWLLIRNQYRSQLQLLCWSPIVLNLVEGQNSFGIVLVLWGAFRAERRGWLWGFALAFALTKPQVAIIPCLWLLWQERRSPLRWHLGGGILLGTLLLALPPTLHDPHIWQTWIDSLGTYRSRILQMPAWQFPGTFVFALAAYLWYRSRRCGWHWWLTAAIFPQVSYYAAVALLPMLRPQRNYWTLAGLGLATLLQIPPTTMTLPLILSGHLLAGWMLAGGPRSIAAPAEAPLHGGGRSLASGV